MMDIQSGIAQKLIDGSRCLDEMWNGIRVVLALFTSGMVHYRNLHERGGHNKFNGFEVLADTRGTFKWRVSIIPPAGGFGEKSYRKGLEIIFCHPEEGGLDHTTLYSVYSHDQHFFTEKKPPADRVLNIYCSLDILVSKMIEEFEALGINTSLEPFLRAPEL